VLWWAVLRAISPDIMDCSERRQVAWSAVTKPTNAQKCSTVRLAEEMSAFSAALSSMRA
jgi:hypothetical protein